MLLFVVVVIGVVAQQSHSALVQYAQITRIFQTVFQALNNQIISLFLFRNGNGK